MVGLKGDIFILLFVCLLVMDVSGAFNASSGQWKQGDTMHTSVGPINPEAADARAGAKWRVWNTSPALYKTQ
jgi:hypothetical protein